MKKLVATVAALAIALPVFAAEKAAGQTWSEAECKKGVEDCKGEDACIKSIKAKPGCEKM